MILLKRFVLNSKISKKMLKRISDLITGKSKNAFNDVVDLFIELTDKIPFLGPDVLDKLSYESVIEFFVENQPEDLVVKGALLRQPHEQGWIAIQVFLNNNNQLVHKVNNTLYGRKLIVHDIDLELKNLFGQNDIIIFE
ncbi:hypothetical protein [Spirosoma foliorum]|uniref:Uncharacterized protein n=1 Tax=Spirosoma foliorum TaxID=2710596 RepID=A0A7G5H2U7_9BACT|nr:hypothetical protein [Spirosoma foliorum]QMW05439.1 hypothetical protein H3H32_11375 [Spirosoma foliorum]